MVGTALDPLRERLLATAGAPDAFEYRARRYQAMYHASGGNDIFPLIAAFGALWARGYLRQAMRAGGALAALHPSRAERADRWARLHRFADAFRRLHQRVLAESAMLKLLATDADLVGLTHILPGELLRGLSRADDAARAGGSTSDADRRALFDGLFRWEQECAVGNRVRDAFAAVEWPLVTEVARRPIVRFAYFPSPVLLRFADFTDMDERIAQGARAYDIAAAQGWSVTGNRLDTALTQADWPPSAERAAACPLSGWLAAAA